MKRTYIRDVLPDMPCKVQGFVENIRDKKTMAFLVIRDITGKIQVTVEKESLPDIAAAVSQLTPDSVVTVTGKAAANPYVKLNGIELIPDSITLESRAEALPIEENSAIDVRLDYRWIDLRSERNTLIFKVQTSMAAAIRDFLLKHNFLEFHSPKIISAASESGAEVFKLNYFGRDAFLAQSPQFYKQMAMAGGFERIFEVGPVFRAEKSNTSKHATEFTGLDLELSYIDSYKDIMLLEEEMLHETLTKIRERHGDDIRRLFNLEVAVPARPFPVMTLREVYAELKTRYGFSVPESEQGDLTTEAEKLTYRLVQDAFGHEFLFVTDFSVEKRPFYHMRKDGVPQGFDLIWKGVEITTGAQREHRYNILRQQADEKGLGQDVKFYMEFFRYGCPPHGGFGLGIDRLTMILLGLAIKEAMFVFRGPDRLNP